MAAYLHPHELLPTGIILRPRAIGLPWSSLERGKFDVTLARSVCIHGLLSRVDSSVLGTFVQGNNDDNECRVDRL